MKTATEITNELSNFYGTEAYHRFSILFPNVVLTDGANWLANNGFGWLMDCIASWQPKALKDPMLREFQLWVLKVNPDKSAVLSCERDTNDVAFKQKIPYTDCPLPELKLYCNPVDETLRCILLTSEY